MERNLTSLPFFLLYTNFITRYLKLTSALLLAVFFSLFTVQNVTQIESSFILILYILMFSAYYHYFVAEYRQNKSLFWHTCLNLFSGYEYEDVDELYSHSIDVILLEEEVTSRQGGIKRERKFDDQTSFDKTSRTHLEMTKDIYCTSMRHETVKFALMFLLLFLFQVLYGFVPLHIF